MSSDPVRDYRHELVLEGLEVEDVGGGGSRDAEVLGRPDFRRVAPTTIKRWLKRRRATGDVEPNAIPPGPPAPKWEALRECLPSHLRPTPT